MLRGMTARQLAEWEAFAEIEPFDEVRDDLRAASIVTALYNIFTREKGQKAMPITDFLLKFGDTGKKKKQTWQELKAIAQMWVAAHNDAQTPKDTRRR